MTEQGENTWLKIKVPSTLHHDLRLLAAQEDRTLTAQVKLILSQYVKWSKEQRAS